MQPESTHVYIMYHRTAPIVADLLKGSASDRCVLECQTYTEEACRVRWRARVFECQIALNENDYVVGRYDRTNTFDDRSAEYLINGTLIQE